MPQSPIGLAQSRCRLPSGPSLVLPWGCLRAGWNRLGPVTGQTCLHPQGAPCRPPPPPGEWPPPARTSPPGEACRPQGRGLLPWAPLLSPWRPATLPGPFPPSRGSLRAAAGPRRPAPLLPPQASAAPGPPQPPAWVTARWIPGAAPWATGHSCFD